MKNKQLILAIDDLIIDYDIENFDQVSYSDRRMLAGEMLIAEGKDSTSWLDAFADTDLYKTVGESLIDCEKTFVHIEIGDLLVNHYLKRMESLVEARISHLNSTDEGYYDENEIDDKEIFEEYFA